MLTGCIAVKIMLDLYLLLLNSECMYMAFVTSKPTFIWISLIFVHLTWAIKLLQIGTHSFFRCCILQCWIRYLSQYVSALNSSQLSIFLYWVLSFVFIYRKYSLLSFLETLSSEKGNLKIRTMQSFSLVETLFKLLTWIRFFSN